MTIWYKVFLYGKTKSLRYLEILHSKLPSPNSLHQSWLHRWFGEGIFRPELWVPTRYSLAMGLAVGWFFGLLPCFGFQIAFALILGFYLRCHFPTAALGTFISNPLTIPAILVLQYALGKRICRVCNLDPLPVYSHWPQVMHHGIPLAIGALTSALAMAILGYGLIWFVWSLTKNPEKKRVEVV